MTVRTRKDPSKKYPLVVEKDMGIPMRDGAPLKCDIFRPKASGKFPVIMNMGPYQKDLPWKYPKDLDDSGQYMNWETVNPEWWVPRGYIAIRVDMRGTGKSPGKAEIWSAQEAIDFYDAIEWAGQQNWSNGNVGLLGISYYGINQWTVASLQPPSLKAIIPWEGFSDLYRDMAFHGGIFASGFLVAWYHNHVMAHHLLGPPQTYNADAFSDPWVWNVMRHRLDDGWYDSRRANFDRITVPLLSVGNWGGGGLHLRGNVEGFVRCASKHKKLRMHVGTHFQPFYCEEGRQDQLRFLDYWLKGIDNGVMDEPPIKLAIRLNDSKYIWRYEDAWPIPRTQWTKYYLNPQKADFVKESRNDGSLSTVPPRNERKESYPTYDNFGHVRPPKNPPPGVTFVTEPMARDTEVTGPVNLLLWVSSESDDMDIFATLRNIGPDGKEQLYPSGRGTGIPLTKGWLKVSHRKLDPKLATFYRPYHPHDEEQKLKPGETVPVEIEIWATSVVLGKGHRLRLDITPVDGYLSEAFTHFNGPYNTGANNHIHMGGKYPSHLLLPIVPPEK